MADGKRYYWLRLHDDFFGSFRIKRLRKMAGGDTYVVIYLKMQLKAMKTDGVLSWKGYEKDFVDELSLDLDEEPDNVRVTLAYLLNCGLAETSDNVNFFLPYAIENTGSETSAAERMRKMRERNNVTPMLRDRYGEKEIEKEIEKKKDTRDRSKGESRGKTKFSPPALDEVKVYAIEQGLECDPEAFYDHFTANGWRVGKGGTPMKDWRAALRNWARREAEFKPRSRATRDSLAYDPNGPDRPEEELPI